jgi:RNA polymerase sigma factor (sigma-70 family)
MSPLALSIRFLKTQPDSKLIELARGGHERAFEALVQRYRRPLLRYCRRLSTSDGAAEDALQQALLQAWVALGSAETTIRDARAWLYRIVHNVAISNLRRPVHDGAYLDLPQGISGADHEVERRLEVRDALAGLASLPEMQRRVMLSTALEGRSHDEIADALGLSHGAVRGLIYRARATLRAAAAALTPSPLLHWAARQEIAAGGRSAGIYEAVVGGGSAGLGGALFKGGALVVSAGALATATGLTGSHSSHHSHRHGAGARRLASEAGPAGLSASSRAAGSTRIEASQVIGAGRGRGASGFGSSGEPGGSGGSGGSAGSGGRGGRVVRAGRVATAGRVARAGRVAKAGRVARAGRAEVTAAAITSMSGLSSGPRRADAAGRVARAARSPAPDLVQPPVPMRAATARAVGATVLMAAAARAAAAWRDRAGADSASLRRGPRAAAPARAGRATVGRAGATTAACLPATTAAAPTVARWVAPRRA